MSKLVCNVAKFKSGQLYGMDIHIQRKTNNHSNKDIDTSRSNLNYELVNGQQIEHYFTAVKKRISQGYIGKKELRKDATLACGVLISSDKNFFDNLTEEQERQFFQTAYEHLCNVYGKENIISAKVHKDETTPHLHAIVVPLTKDGRLTAKELFDRKALTALHNEIPKKLKARGFNIERGEKNADVKRLETDEYKKLKEQNKVSVQIEPNEIFLYKIGEEKTFFGKKDILETQADVAKRLEKKYIEPLAKELTELRTEKAIEYAKKSKLEWAKQFSKSYEDQFKELYYSVKEFGSEHVDSVLEKLRDVVGSLNREKRQQDEMLQKQKTEDLVQRRLQNLSRAYGGSDDLCEVLDVDFAPYNFEVNGKKTYYVAAQALKDKAKKLLWDDSFAELKLKIGEIIHIKGDKIERAAKIQVKQGKGMRM